MSALSQWRKPQRRLQVIGRQVRRVMVIDEWPKIRCKLRTPHQAMPQDLIQPRGRTPQIPRRSGPWPRNYRRRTTCPITDKTAARKARHRRPHPFPCGAASAHSTHSLGSSETESPCEPECRPHRQPDRAPGDTVTEARTDNAARPSGRLSAAAAPANAEVAAGSPVMCSRTRAARSGESTGRPATPAG